jgi:hypothetical protein
LQEAGRLGRERDPRRPRPLQGGEGGRPAKDKVITETQEAIEEANGLERPLLERNLIALSTIAVDRDDGRPARHGARHDPLVRRARHVGRGRRAKLALGISEALVNTAGGLIGAIVGILRTTCSRPKVDNFSYMIDEASFEAVQFLSTRRTTGPPGRRGQDQEQADRYRDRHDAAGRRRVPAASSSS